MSRVTFIANHCISEVLQPGQAMFEEAVDLDEMSSGDEDVLEARPSKAVRDDRDEKEWASDDDNEYGTLQIKSVCSLSDPLVNADQDDARVVNVLEITDLGEEEEKEDEDTEYLDTSIDPTEMLAMEMEEEEEDNERSSSPEVVEVLPSPPLRRGPGRPRKDGSFPPGANSRTNRRGGGRRGRPRKYPEAPFTHTSVMMPAQQQQQHVPPPVASMTVTPSPLEGMVEFKRGRGRPRNDEYVTLADGRVVAVGSNSQRSNRRRRRGGPGEPNKGVGGRMLCPFCQTFVANVESYRDHLRKKHSRK